MFIKTNAACISICHQHARLRSVKLFFRVIESSARITLTQFYYTKPVSRTRIHTYMPRLNATY